MIRELEVFFAALRFFTRLPVPSRAGHSEQQLEQSARYLPLVGLIVGSIGALVTVAAAQGLPPSLFDWLVALRQRFRCRTVRTQLMPRV